jgi:hypothetical protein
VRDFLTEGLLVVLIKLCERFETRGILGDESTLLKNGQLVLETLVARKGLDFGEELVLGNALERVGYSIEYGLADLARR